MSFSQEDVDAVMGALDDDLLGAATEVFTDRETVRTVQQELKRRGYKIKVDGIIGLETRRIVAFFNAAHGVAQGDSRITSATLAALGVQPLGAPTSYQALAEDLARGASGPELPWASLGTPAAPKTSKGVSTTSKIALASAAVPTCGADGMEGWWYLVAVLCVIMGMALFFGLLGQDRRK